MHLSEFALRDFVNVERHADWTAAIVFDDILPTAAPSAPRACRSYALRSSGTSAGR